MSQVEEPRFYIARPRSWKSAKRIGLQLGDCIFRGQSNSEWPLSTTIERAANKFNCPRRMIGGQEISIIQEFKTRAHHFIQSPPSDDEYIEWLSLIQHFGGPTRILDFTYSFYIASFFAMETSEKDACVWAITRTYIEKRNIEQIDSELTTNDYWKLVTSHLRDNFYNDSTSPYAEVKYKSFVFHVRPPRLNERLAVQKGTFLFQCNLLESFESNLCKTLGFSFDSFTPNNAIKFTSKEYEINHPGIKVVKIILSRKIHCDAILDLDTMNINATSLFPDLGGFARSLWSSMRQVERLGIPPKKK